MHTLSISDGTTTVSLISGSALDLAASGWPLAVAPPQVSHGLHSLAGLSGLAPPPATPPPRKA